MYGFVTTEGLYGPPFCVDGSINENAWGYFSEVSPHVLAAGRGAAVDQVDHAIQTDAGQGATADQEYWAYSLAAAYYGWSFTPDPACVQLYGEDSCKLSPPVYSAAQSSVRAQVLPPATVPPSVELCSADVSETADGNWEPMFCGRALNIVAWREYVTLGPRILAAGKNASPDQVRAALKADESNNPTAVEELDAYLLAALYYGWHFSPDPACEFLYKQTACY